MAGGDPAPLDLPTFMAQLEVQNDLIRIKAEADPFLEITEITDRISKLPEAQNKALLFENPKGYNIPLLINALGTHPRMLRALGLLNTGTIADYKALQDRIRFYVKPDMAMLSGALEGGLLDKMTMLPQFAELRHIFPQPYKTTPVAPCQEVVITDTTQPMLDKLPILTCWPDDGGPFITFGTIFLKDPKTGEKNVGMYRMQKYDNATTGMHWHKHHDGKRIYENARAMGLDRLEVAVALGAPQHVVYSATAPLPPGIHELLFAGFLHKKAVEMVKCKTVDIDVPAHSEIILEGYVLLDELRREGPFGDHTGFYSLVDDYPVFHLTAMTHRKNPVYQTTIVGKPPQEDCYMGKATEQMFLPLAQLFLPEIVDMNLPWEGVFHNCVILSIKKRYPGHARKVMSGIWGLGQMMFSKYIIVVDEHVNVQNPSEVAFHVFNNTDPQYDMMFSEGPQDVLDHGARRYAYGTKVGIDATRRWDTEGYTREWPDEIEMSDAIKAQVSAKWQQWFPTP
ncbi:MAG: menaquinone biosynthesis decarboxylase [Vampirovibrionales bacterium]